MGSSPHCSAGSPLGSGRRVYRCCRLREEEEEQEEEEEEEMEEPEADLEEEEVAQSRT